MTARELWDRYCRTLCCVEGLGFQLDISRMRFADDFLPRMEPRMQAAFAEMEALEAGAIANPDENRMVGHYWLRAPERAPTPEIRRCHRGDARRDRGLRGRRARGARRAADAPRASRTSRRRHRRLGARPAVRRRRARRAPGDPLQPLLLRQHRPRRHRPRAGAPRRAPRGDAHVVISKSGGTQGDAQRHARGARGLPCARACDFARHAVAVTGDGSELDSVRTSATAGSRASRCGTGSAAARPRLSAVGLLPAALQGLDIDAHARRRARRWTRRRARRDTAAEPRRAARADVAPRRAAAAARRTWSSCPTRTACCCSAATCSSS